MMLLPMVALVLVSTAHQAVESLPQPGTQLSAATLAAQAESLLQRRLDSALVAETLARRAESLTVARLDSVYVQDLRRTNELMIGRYAALSVFIEAMGILFTIGAIVAGYMIYRQDKNFRDKRDQLIAKFNAELDGYRGLLSAFMTDAETRLRDLDSQIEETKKLRSTVASEDDKLRIERRLAALEARRANVNSGIQTARAKAQYSDWLRSDLGTVREWFQNQSLGVPQVEMLALSVAEMANRIERLRAERDRLAATLTPPRTDAIVQQNAPRLREITSEIRDQRRKMEGSIRRLPRTYKLDPALGEYLHDLWREYVQAEEPSVADLEVTDGEGAFTCPRCAATGRVSLSQSPPTHADCEQCGLYIEFKSRGESSRAAESPPGT